MDKNFKVRAVVCFGLFAVALVGLYTLNAVPFKILFALFSVMAGVELASFFTKRVAPTTMVLAVLQMIFLIGGAMFVARTTPGKFWYVILGVPGYDVFAYLFGKIFGGKVFGKSRPFPRISKNKTWEGTILGLTMAVGMVVMLMGVRGTLETDWMYLLCGPLALVGDLYESYLKRQFKVKDSGEIVAKKNRWMARIEGLVGGSAGHGGYLDRIDSVAFTTTVLLIMTLVVGV